MVGQLLVSTTEWYLCYWPFCVDWEADGHQNSRLINLLVVWGGSLIPLYQRCCEQSGNRHLNSACNIALACGCGHANVVWYVTWHDKILWDSLSYMILAVVIINYYTPCSCFEFATMVNRVRLLCPFVAFCGFLFVFLVLRQQPQYVMGLFSWTWTRIRAPSSIMHVTWSQSYTQFNSLMAHKLGSLSVEVMSSFSAKSLDQ